jgi:penicillin-binding protein 2
LAKLVGIIATDGRIPDIHIVKNSESKQRRQYTFIHPDNIRKIKKAMVQVVQSDRGTGQFARVDFLRMGAKTGTAQVPPHEPHSWFTGFFPYENPKYVLTIFIEHGGPGGYHAARLAKEIVLEMKTLGFFGEAAAHA